MNAIRLINNAEVVVSSRLHGCIMSHSLGVPYVPLNCDKKIPSFIESHTTIKCIDVERLYDYADAFGLIRQAMETFVQEKIDFQVSHLHDVANTLIK
jgi:polysaccharide pyruvyl transferase WcaK-like protein